MGSDSGLSRGGGYPEQCEAVALRWQERAGCQSPESAFNTAKSKEIRLSAPAQPSRGAAAAAAWRRKGGRNGRYVGERRDG